MSGVGQAATHRASNLKVRGSTLGLDEIFVRCLSVPPTHTEAEKVLEKYKFTSSHSTVTRSVKCVYQRVGAMWPSVVLTCTTCSGEPAEMNLSENKYEEEHCKQNRPELPRGGQCEQHFFSKSLKQLF